MINYEKFKELVGTCGKTIIGKEGDWILTLKVPDSDWEEANTILGFVSQSFGYGNNKLYKSRFIKGTVQFDGPYDDVPITNDFMKNIGCTKVTEAMKWFSEHRNQGYAFQVGDTDKYVLIKDLTMTLTHIFSPSKLPEDKFKEFIRNVKG